MSVGHDRGRRGCQTPYTHNEGKEQRDDQIITNKYNTSGSKNKTKSKYTRCKNIHFTKQ